MKWRLSTWARCSTPSGVGTARLIVSPLASPSASSTGVGEVDEVGVGDAAAGEAEQHRTGPHAAAGAVALEQAAPLERRDRTRDGALGKAATLRKLAHARGAVALHDQDEKLRGAVDRLGPGHCIWLRHMKHSFHIQES